MDSLLAAGICLGVLFGGWACLWDGGGWECLGILWFLMWLLLLIPGFAILKTTIGTTIFLIDSRSRFAPTPEFPICGCCGYDLRATPRRCPECGTVPPPPVRKHKLIYRGYVSARFPRRDQSE